jgi:uncharacterized protein YcbK (DUF882 family)
MNISRRRLIAAGCGLVAAPALGFGTSPQRRVKFQHAHTLERLDVVYFEAGHYVPDALDSVNHLLRDFRTGEQFAMDPRLLDSLSALLAQVDYRGALEVISGFRSPATNNMLRRNSNGVAKRSFHMVGKAIDVRLTSLGTAKLRDAALAAQVGGVGYYPKSDFVHIDTGPVRTW